MKTMKTMKKKKKKKQNKEVVEEEKDNIYNLGSTVSLKQPKRNTLTCSLNSFRYKGAKIWNDLPN